jgi:hypothetical protein
MRPFTNSSRNLVTRHERFAWKQLLLRPIRVERACHRRENYLPSLHVEAICEVSEACGVFTLFRETKLLARESSKTTYPLTLTRVDVSQL